MFLFTYKEEGSKIHHFDKFDNRNKIVDNDANAGNLRSGINRAIHPDQRSEF